MVGVGVNGPAFVLEDAFRGLKLSSQFDSGNLASARVASDGTFELWTAPDCYGTAQERQHSSWFYFEVSGKPLRPDDVREIIGRRDAAANRKNVSGYSSDARVPESLLIKFRVMNMKKHAVLFKQGYKPVFRCPRTGMRWQRIGGLVQFELTDEYFRVDFTYDVAAKGALPVRLAFCYPHSYEESQSWLEGTEEKADLRADVYFRRELLVRSLDGRRVDLLTISDVAGADKEGRCESYLEEVAGEGAAFLFPDRPSGPETSSPALQETPTLQSDGVVAGTAEKNGEPMERPLLFPRKPVVLLTARVHPGETPGSFAMQGAVDFLLSNDPRADLLRKRFVFKIIPMLNPDGVARGHFRLDNRGRNLNRFYGEPDPLEHPTIFGARCVGLHAARGGTGGPGLALYVDFHAHASKRGCFIYGNSMDALEQQVENQLFARLVSINSQHFDYSACNFTRKHMTRTDRGDEGLSAEGTGRVALFIASGALRCYTLECNYNTDKIVNEVPNPAGVGGKRESPRGRNKSSARSKGRDVEADGKPACRSVSPGRPAYLPRPYTVADWAEVGRGCLVALLDAEERNPYSRLADSKYRTLHRLRCAIASEIRSISPYRKQSLKMRQRQQQPLSNSEKAPGVLGKPSVSAIYGHIIETCPVEV